MTRRHVLSAALAAATALVGAALALAGATSLNLWPESWPQAHKSDPKETAWKRAVCNGTLTLKQAQAAELAYKRTHG